MASSRSFTYNIGVPINGTNQVGEIAVGIPSNGYEATGLEWWNGPDEELGYVICEPVPNETQPTPVKMYLNPNNVGPGNTLSNNNTTVTSTGYSSVIAESKIFGRVMFSVQLEQSATSSYIGIGKSDMDLNSYVGSSDGKSVGFGSSGDILFGGSYIFAGLPSWGTVGDIIDIAIDSSVPEFWVRVNGGDWNGNPASDPGVNTGGLSFPMSVMDTYPAITVYQVPSNEAQATLVTSPFTLPSFYSHIKNYASVKFSRSSDLTDASFVELVNRKFSQNLLTAQACKAYLTANDIWTSWGSLPAGMVLYLDAGLASSYPGSGSTWYDLSGNGNHGTINGGATYSPSQGGVLGFDGVNDYVSFNTVSNIPIGNDNYTISIWFNTTSSNTTGGFFGWGNYGTTNQVNAFRLLANGAGFVNYWWANDQNFNTTVNANTWYNVIAKFDGTNREIWLNGTLVGSVAPSPGHNVPNADNLTIGLTAPFLNEYFPGKIGQVVFYRRGATNQEIQSIYNSGVGRFV
jgi:hypothetical protein